MKSYKFYSAIILFVSMFLCHSCEEETELPFNQVIPPENSGLIGLWEGVSLEKKFAKNLKDALGNTLNDDKNRPMWVDTLVVKSNTDGYAEYIQFRSAGNVNAFASNRVNELDLDAGTLIPGTIPNMPISTGQWAVIKTINPSGEMDDITSVNLFNPDDRHSNFSSMIWTIKSVNTSELVIEYTFGPQLYDTLFVKTFRKL